MKRTARLALASTLTLCLFPLTSPVLIAEEPAIYGSAVSELFFPGTRWWDTQSRAFRARAEQYRSALEENFEWGVLANAGKFHPMHGKSRAGFFWRDIDILVKWFEDNGLKLKYHTLLWDVPGGKPPWFRRLSRAEKRVALEEHVRTIVSRYKGRIALYDVVNHPIRGYIHMRGDKDSFMGTGWSVGEATARAFRWAHEEDPDATLLINEGITSERVLREYVALVKDLVKAGVPIHGIGEMAHLGKPDGRLATDQQINRILDELASTGLPVYITEFDMGVATPKEKKPLVAPEKPFEGFDTCWDYQGWAYRHFYELASRHPAVKGVFSWGFYDGQIFRPGGGLFDEDFEPKPAYHELLKGGFLKASGSRGPSSSRSH
jgi:endo-1,4-beta-xylanase